MNNTDLFLKNYELEENKYILIMNFLKENIDEDTINTINKKLNIDEDLKYVQLFYQGKAHQELIRDNGDIKNNIINIRYDKYLFDLLISKTNYLAILNYDNCFFTDVENYINTKKIYIHSLNYSKDKIELYEKFNNKKNIMEFIEYLRKNNNNYKLNSMKRDNFMINYIYKPFHYIINVKYVLKAHTAINKIKFIFCFI